MLVTVKMKNKTMFKGIKCGSEGGLVYLVNPCLLEEDPEEMGGPFQTAVGDEVQDDVRILQIPLADIETIESAN